ncbi:hypothetical protein [Polaribacter aquimarinus]|uniref:UDP-glycosyltransferase n=1 Tax=Polaribacter aquimarinus TaxID=2100726 RepID=A0A2U2J7G5_9FLAO|nr:hypothetical protein [Polaribacter aquimarinus]PWG04283.1 hypothetical protein DIS07_12785 [Polaribacter aquimarinus]
MKKKELIVFVVPDGTGIKNYLFSNIIPILIQKGKDVFIYHSLDENALNEVRKIHNIEFESKAIPTFKEPFKQKFLREAIAYARLNYNSKIVNNPTILTNWNSSKKGVLKKAFYFLVEKSGKYLSKKYSRILNFEEKYQQTIKSTIYKDIQFLEKLNPESLFFTHQRSVKAIPILHAAKQLKIKTIGAIYSWDNIPKGRLALRTQKYVVWSNYMKKELKFYYPEINEENIIITGSPQFDFYKKESIIDKKENFYKTYNLDLSKRTVCFSGGDELTSPYDQNYLQDIAEEIKKNKKENEIQILFRRCPVDISSRYDKVIEKYKDLIIPIHPLWSNDSKHWSTLFPYYDDIKLLANICKHSDLVFNIGSTIALDFAAFDRPAAYLNYDTCEDKNWSVKTIYNFEHFKSMPDKNQVFWVNSKNDILKIIEKASKTNFSLGKDWFNIINIDNDNISLNIVNQIIK